MSKIFDLKGVVQNYAWGGSTFIPELLGIEKGTKPYAEYWLGAHTNAPSILTTSAGKEKLNDFIEKKPEDILGTKVAKSFGRLPYLFKVLDVKEMLSIQVHPTKTEAEKGFTLENRLGIPLDAPNRNYKDDNHKPEIMVALGEFWLLHGFLSQDKLLKRLEATQELNDLISAFSVAENGYLSLYKMVMEEEDEGTERRLRPLVNRILPLYKKGLIDKSNPDYWAAKAVDMSGGKLDKGIYSIYFFNLLKVNKGEAVFQDAGIPHAYLEGQNMELMANSDNVLRAGLTPKHVDVEELLKHVDFRETVPNILTGKLSQNGFERVYESPVADFELSQIQLKNDDKYLQKANTAEILIVMHGKMILSETNEHAISAEKGDAILVTANCNYQISTSSEVVLYKATTGKLA